MNREEAHKHKKRKWSGGLFVGGIFVAVCVSVLIAFLFALGGGGFLDIFFYREYLVGGGGGKGSVVLWVSLLFWICGERGGD